MLEGIYHTSKAEVEDILKYLRKEKDRLNGNENRMSIDYACGWALSEDYKECTMQILLDKADSYMYDNKQLCKQQDRYPSKGDDTL